MQSKSTLGFSECSCELRVGDVKATLSRSRPRHYFEMSRSILSLATSLRSRAISGHLAIAEKCFLGLLGMLAHPVAQHILVHIQIWAAWRTETQRSSTNCTASGLNSQLNFRPAAIDSA